MGTRTLGRYLFKKRPAAAISATGKSTEDLFFLGFSSIECPADVVGKDKWFGFLAYHVPGECSSVWPPNNLG